MPSATRVVIPLFPLPRTVLLPKSLLNLYIYEPRYKEMIGRCLSMEKPFGVLLLRPDRKGLPDEDAACRIGGSGLISGHKVVGKNGEMLIIVRGVHRFRLLEFIPGESYPQGRVEYLEPTWGKEGDMEPHLTALRDGLASTLRYSPPMLSKMADTLGEIPDAGALADAIIGTLPLDPARKQAFLEVLDPAVRAQSVAQILHEEGFRLSILDSLRSGDAGRHQRN